MRLRYFNTSIVFEHIIIMTMYDAKITQLMQLLSIFLHKKHNFTISIFNFAKVLLEDVVGNFISRTPRAMD